MNRWRKFDIGVAIAILGAVVSITAYLTKLSARLTHLEDAVKGSKPTPDVILVIQKELSSATDAIERESNQALTQLRRATAAHAERLSLIEPRPVGTTAVMAPRWIVQGDMVEVVSDQIKVKAVSVSELTRSATFEIDTSEEEPVRCPSMNVGERKLLTRDGIHYLFSFLRVRRSSSLDGNADEAEVCVVRRL